VQFETAPQRFLQAWQWRAEASLTKEEIMDAGLLILRLVLGLAMSASIVSARHGPSHSTPQNAAPLPCVASNGITPICGVHAPEDIELLPDDRHLLISEFPADFSRVTGEGLLLVDLTTHRVQPLMVGTHPETGWGEKGCNAPPAHFGSHGIHLSKRNDGRRELLVVNHGERESIEQLELIHTPDGYRAV
jgi:hypothetical protein